MKEKNELSYRDLKMICNKDMFHFETTEELEPINDGIGQERGIKALQFGINVDVKGYNLYIEGPSGVGKTMYTKNYLNVISKKKTNTKTQLHKVEEMYQEVKNKGYQLQELLQKIQKFLYLMIVSQL